MAIVGTGIDCAWYVHDLLVDCQCRGVLSLSNCLLLLHLVACAWPSPKVHASSLTS